MSSKGDTIEINLHVDGCSQVDVTDGVFLDSKMDSCRRDVNIFDDKGDCILQLHIYADSFNV